MRMSMFASMCALSLVAWSAVVVAELKTPSTRTATLTRVKTPVEIVSVEDVGADVEAVVVTRGTTPDSQVVVLVQYWKSNNAYFIAADEAGVPVMPLPQSASPQKQQVQQQVQKEPTSSAQAMSGEQRWSVTFHRKPFGGIREVHAIVCKVRQRRDWPRSRDYRGFAYLPFDRAENIDEVLALLRDFGWEPTGVTKRAP
jgi:hypothetical protein